MDRADEEKLFIISIICYTISEIMEEPYGFWRKKYQKIKKGAE